MVVEDTPIIGLKVLRNFVSYDSRGIFIKTYNAAQFAQVGLPFVQQESYYSVSHKGVIRGMHFQLPPYAHEKLVYVTSGRILDVVVDLRIASKTYKQVFSIELASHEAALYIPKGFAHGFLALTSDATVVYSVATGYQPTADAGVYWNSLGFVWPIAAPIVSDRDAAFPALRDFPSPF